VFLSFFPKPKLFFISFALWALACVLGWYLFVQHWGHLSLASLFGFHFPEPVSPEATEAAKALYDQGYQRALNLWQYQYMALCYGLFIGGWVIYGGQKWAKWSVIGSGLIVFITWFQVQVSVMINTWYGNFYNLIQKALTTPNSITADEYYSQLFTFATIALVAITVAVLNNFFVSHYVFRWRTAMNNYYTSKWPQVRRIEGASQRI
jgi:peptide/bleomycin uptake transporter